MRNKEEEILQRPIPIDPENAKHVHFRVRRKLPGRRLDKYLHGRYPHLSRTAIQRLIRQGAVTVNGSAAKPSYEMNGGDLIEMTMPDPEPPDIVAQDIPLDILFEDEHIIAINKEAGIVCHPAHAAQTGTIANALAYYSANLSSGSDPFRPGIVHRLDKNTTGVMLTAKTDEAHWRLSLQFETRTIQKIYLAVVSGGMELDGDTIDLPIGMHPVVREKIAVMIKPNKINVAKNAVTHWEVAERFRGYTLVKLSPKTGRTHQLRVHMSYIGHPVVGDQMYGGPPASMRALTGAGDETPFMPYQALHAWRIEFKHPIKETPMSIEAPFRTNFKKLMRVLRRHRSV